MWQWQKLHLPETKYWLLFFTWEGTEAEVGGSDLRIWRSIIQPNTRQSRGFFLGGDLDIRDKSAQVVPIWKKAEKTQIKLSFVISALPKGSKRFLNMWCQWCVMKVWTVSVPAHIFSSYESLTRTFTVVLTGVNVLLLPRGLQSRFSIPDVQRATLRVSLKQLNGLRSSACITARNISTHQSSRIDCDDVFRQLAWAIGRAGLLWWEGRDALCVFSLWLGPKPVSSMILIALNQTV